MSFDNVLHFAKSQVTGGAGDALDGIDVTDASFMIGSVCRVYKNDAGERSVLFYVAEDSGAAADGDTIVAPTGYAGDIRWHLYGSSGGSSGITVSETDPTSEDGDDGDIWVVV